VTPHCGSTPRVSSNGLSASATKFAEPSNDRAVRFIQRWSKKAAIHFLCPFLVCAFGEQRRMRGAKPIRLVGDRTRSVNWEFETSDRRSRA